MKKQVRLNQLVIDEKLTSIRKVNPVFVSRYRQAYRSGANMPLPIIEKGTNRVVSGNHRVSAMLMEFASETKVSVEERKFKNEAEVLKVFAEENATHGNPIDSFTKKNLTLEMIKQGVSEREIAQILNVSVNKIQKYGEDVVSVKIGNKTEQKPVKNSFPKHVKEMSEGEYEEHSKHDRGYSVYNQAKQLKRWIENDYIDMEKDAEILTELKNVIEEKIESELV